MKKILIENVQVGISEGGMACGPIGGSVVVEAQIRVNGGETFFYGMTECVGASNFYKCDESRYEAEINEELPEPDEFFDEEGFCDYDEFYGAVNEMMKEDEAHALLLKYLVYLARADWNEIEAMKKNSIGRYIGDFDIPVCDAEEDYLEDNDGE